jgi:hypothetical protein
MVPVGDLIAIGFNLAQSCLTHFERKKVRGVRG